MELLYQVESLIDPANYPGAQPGADAPFAELSWYAVDRATSIAPYDTLIVGYHNLPSSVKADAEHYMDEWLTREEVAQLLPYLCLELGHTVRRQWLPVPMNIFLADGTSMATPVARVVDGERWRVAHTLSADGDQGYPLPFAVSAYYLATPE
jgi:hypothetical protein